MEHSASVDILHKIVFSAVRSDICEVQAESGIVILADRLEFVMSDLYLRNMVLERLPGDIKTRLPAEGIQWLSPVHGNCVFGILMQIQLLDLPGAIFFCGFRILVPVGGQFQAYFG